MPHGSQVTPKSLKRYGSSAWLLSCDPIHVPGLLAAIDQRLGPTVEAVPGARSILIRHGSSQSGSDLARLAEQLRRLEPLAVTVQSYPEVTLAVSYSGPDLDQVANSTGLTVDQVIEIHQATSYRVGFCGFSPGFGYLTGLDPRLVLPRRETPRARVPTGSVAIADEYSAVYPRSSPGGWHLIGQCQAELFDLKQDPPALLTPGTRVRFRAVAAEGTNQSRSEREA